MAAGYDLEARKRPVNLTLNENLVDQAKALTGNLSAVVESLLSDFVTQERKAQAARSRSVAEAVAAWNAFNEKSGSIADEYCSL